MNEALTPLVLSLLAGIAVGALFFGGLWWTTKKILAPGQPALWFVGSFLVRVSVTLAVFYVVAQGDWQRLLICLLGFLLARIVVIRLTRSATPRIEARAP
jgi:F1F0 ATPase subunit 2